MCVLHAMEIKSLMSTQLVTKSKHDCIIGGQNVWRFYIPAEKENQVCDL
jgi:hypothetical protein